MKTQSRKFMFVAMLALAGGGCGVEGATGESAAQDSAAVLRGTSERESAGNAAPEAALLARGWERAPNAAAVAPLRGDNGAAAEGTLAGQPATRTLGEASWLARDGRRYEALFISPDGTTYGRREAARTMATPDTDSHHGAFDPLAGRGAAELPATRTVVDTGAEDPLIGIILGGTLDSDRRARYSNVADLEAYPMRTVGSLSGSGNTQSGGCTGTLVGPRHVLTAAHCVMNADGDITTSGFFNPGQTNTTINNGGNSRRWSGVMLRDFRVARRFDYALLYLENRADNASLGWMGVTWWNSTSSYTDKYAYNKGYPCGPNMTCGGIANQKCKASPRADKRCDGWMYGDSTALHSGAATSDDRLEYDLDTSDGHSGSAIYTYIDGAPAVMAVHYGPSGSYNAGSRFRTTMWNDICTWIADVPSSFATHSLCH